MAEHGRSSATRRSHRRRHSRGLAGSRRSTAKATSAAQIIAAEEEFELEDLIAEEDMVIAISQAGYVKRLPVGTYREQRAARA